MPKNIQKFPLEFPLEAPVFSGRSRVVPLGNVLLWLQQGWAMFAAYPTAWLLATFVLFFGFGLLALIFIMGSVVAVFLFPMISVGFLQFSAKAARHQSPKFADLWQGFSQQTSPLLRLGLVYLGAAALLIGFYLLALFNINTAGRALLVIIAAIILIVFCTCFCLTLLWIFTSLTHALIFFNKLNIFHALSASFSACLKNSAALLLLALVSLMLFFLSSLLMGLGLFIVIPVLAGTIYAAYHDIFLAH